MGCGCGKNANRPTRNTAAKIPGAIKSNVPSRAQQASVTPRNNLSVSGLSINRQAINKQRQDAIKKSLGGK